MDNSLEIKLHACIQNKAFITVMCSSKLDLKTQFRCNQACFVYS